MKKEDIKTISDLLRDAFGVFGEEVKTKFAAVDEGFDAMGRHFKKVETDISGLTVLMVENFTETQERIEKMRSATEGFLKLHDVLDGRVVEQDRKIDALERKVEKLESLVEKLAS
jgi:DNA anti-recombination protein RmuC